MTLLVLAGPTAAGKTEAALEVAVRWGATVVSADAMQVYRYLDIGTAKPSPEELARAPHVGIDVVDPDEPFDAARFVDLAEATLASGVPVVVAGGTALYIRSLIRGLVATPPVDAALRAEIEGIDDLHGELTRVDPELAARLHPHDRKRLVRGLEVFRATGERLSELQRVHAEAPDRHRVVGLWLDRHDLDARIDARLGAMVARGYVDEVRALLAAGWHRDLKPMQSLGYKHLCDHVIDGLDHDEALRRTSRDTRRFARKQRTWMRQLDFPRVQTDHVGQALAAATRALGGCPADVTR